MVIRAKPRESAISINIPELTTLLAPWRDATVEVATKGVPPHITLLYPWRTPPLAPTDLESLRAAVGHVHAFSITLNRFGRFDSNVLFLQPEDDSPIRELMRALFTAFPDTPPYGGAIPDPTPHLTVAEASGDEQLLQFEREASRAIGPHLPLTFQVGHITVVEQDEHGTWHEFAALPLLSSP